MSKPTVNTSMPPMPAWATEREDSDYHVPGDGFTRFSAVLGRLKAQDWDTAEVTLKLVGSQYAQSWDGEHRALIEVWRNDRVLLTFTPTGLQAFAERAAAIAAQFEAVIR